VDPAVAMTDVGRIAGLCLHANRVAKNKQRELLHVGRPKRNTEGDTKPSTVSPARMVSGHAYCC